MLPVFLVNMWKLVIENAAEQTNTTDLKNLKKINTGTV